MITTALVWLMGYAANLCLRSSEEKVTIMVRWCRACGFGVDEVWGRGVLRNIIFSSKVFEIIVRHHRARPAVMIMDHVESTMMELAQSSLRQSVATVLRQRVRINNLRRQERNTNSGQERYRWCWNCVKTKNRSYLIPTRGIWI
jgi:hypothetical protein